MDLQCLSKQPQFKFGFSAHVGLEVALPEASGSHPSQ